MPRKILFVAMQSSPHAARWIDSVADTNWELHFFGVDQALPNAKLRGVNLHWPELSSELQPKLNVPAAGSGSFADRIARFSLLAMRDPREAWRRIRARFARLFDRETAWARLRALPQRRGLRMRSRRATADPAHQFKLSKFQPSLAELGGPDAVGAGFITLGESDCTAPVLNGPSVLVTVIRRVQPDLIHSMEFQHAGYLVLRARELYGADFPTWLATNWGSDIFYFGTFPDHQAQINRLLRAVDFYSCECKRDVTIARQLGYRGPILPTLPNSGGFDLNHIRSLRSREPPSRRKSLMIKGYDHFAGRAMVALKVLETLANRLDRYRIVLFSAGEQPRRRALELSQRGVLDIEVIDHVTHDEMLSRFAQARLYMGISIADGISTSALEAMAMGTFPIQTNTSCCDEWFKDGEGGFIVRADDFDHICSRFLSALMDDELVDRAAEINWQTVQERLDRAIIAPQVVALYDQVASKPPALRRADSEGRTD